MFVVKLGGRVALAALLALNLGGCVASMLGVPFLDQAATAISAAATATSGSGLVEHALDLTTGRDCRIIDKLVRSDRRFCEPRGSIETEKNFKCLGSIAAFRPHPSAVATEPDVAATDLDDGERF